MLRAIARRGIYVLQKRMVAHGIDGVHIAAVNRLIALGLVARLVVLVYYVADKFNAPACVYVHPSFHQ